MGTVSSSDSSGRVFRGMDATRQDGGETGISKDDWYTRSFTYKPLEGGGVYTPIKLNRTSVLKFLERSYQAQGKQFIEGSWKRFWLSDKEISAYLRAALSGKLSNLSEIGDHSAFSDPKNLTARKADQFAKILLLNEKPAGIDEQHIQAFAKGLQDYSDYGPFSIEIKEGTITIKGKDKEGSPLVIGVLYPDKEEIGLRSAQGHLQTGKRTFNDGTVEAGVFSESKEDSILWDGFKKSPSKKEIFFKGGIQLLHSQPSVSRESTAPASIGSQTTATTSRENAPLAPSNLQSPRQGAALPRPTAQQESLAAQTQQRQVDEPLEGPAAMDVREAPITQTSNISAEMPIQTGTPFSTASGNTGLHYQSLFECLGLGGTNRISFLPLLKENAKTSDFLSGESQFDRLVKKEKQIHDFSRSFLNVLKQIQPSRAFLTELQEKKEIAIYQDKNFSISIKTNNGAFEFVIKSKEGLLSNEKTFYRFSSFSDVGFSSLIKNFEEYSQDFLPETKHFLSSITAPTSSDPSSQASVSMLFSGTRDSRNDTQIIYRGETPIALQRIFPGPGTQRGLVGNLLDAAFGTGMEEQLEGIKKETETILLEKIASGPKGKPLLINLEGNSRGCYNAVAIAHFLQNPSPELKKKLDEKGITLDIQLTLRDPVKGPIHNPLLTEDSIPPVVSQLNIIYSKLAFALGIDKGLFIIEDTSRTRVSISLNKKSDKEERTLTEDHMRTFQAAKLTRGGKTVGGGTLDRGEIRAFEEEVIDLSKPFSKTTKNQAVINYLARRAEEFRQRLRSQSSTSTDPLQAKRADARSETAARVSPVDIAIESLASLGKNEQEKHQIASFVRELLSSKNVPPTEQKSFCDSLKPILEGITEPGGIIKILSYLKEKVEKPQKLCEPAARLMQGVESAAERIEILAFVRGNTAAGMERETFCAIAGPILAGITGTGGRKELLERIKKESADKRELLCGPARKLMAGVTNAADRLKILEFAKTIKSEVRIDFCNDVSSLLEGITDTNINDLLELLRFAKGELNLNAICTAVKPLLQNRMTAKERLEILKFVALQNAGEREEICKDADSFFTFFKFVQKRIPETLTSYRPAFCRATGPLLRNTKDVLELLELVLDMPVLYLKEFCKAAEGLPSAIAFLNSVKECATGIGRDREQEILFGLIKSLIGDVQDPFVRLDIVKFIAQQTVKERKLFCKLANVVAPDKRLDLLKSIKSLSNEGLAVDSISVRCPTSSDVEVEIGMLASGGGVLQKGRRQYVNGMTEEGTFVTGKLHGPGCKRIYKDGRIEKGRFEDGVFQVQGNALKIQDFITKLRASGLISDNEGGGDISTVEAAGKLYKRLSAKYHPDSSSPIKDAEKFKVLSDAYELIKDL